MVEVENLTKYYGDLAAVDGVTFAAQKGEILGFLGPNGAGKTTTMRIIAGFMPPDRGTARVAGYDVVEDSVEARRHLGYLPENVPLYDDMTVGHYLTFFAKLRGVSKKQLRACVEAALEATDVAEREHWLIGKLSKGFRRRVGIAQALVHNPDVLILDEPTEGLDPIQVIAMRDLIRKLRGQRTIFLSTHILPEAQAMSDRIVIIDRGRVVAIDTTHNLTTRLQRVHRLRVEVRGPRTEVQARLNALPGILRVDSRDTRDGATVFDVEGSMETDVRERISTTIVKNGWALLELDTREMTLEEIFLELTRRQRPAGASQEVAKV
ncbi:MAG: ABC transporter ATP-binding protein [Armatimonadetes bacterium]|nr:ABC transporter ATP-binding protein [Armatimonadota bacterium]